MPRRLASLAPAVALAAAFGCKPRQDGSDATALIGDRALLGVAPDYKPDIGLDAAIDMKARRELGWRVALKALASIEIKAQREGATPVSLPLWQTWYSAGEFESLLTELYRYNQDPELKALRARFPDKNGLVPFPQRLVDGAFESYVASARAGHLPAWKKRDLEEHFKKFKTEDDDRRLGVHEEVGRSTKGTSVFNPTLLKHLLSEYSTVHERCIASSQSAFIDGDQAPRDEANFTACLSKEMPAGAVAVKTTWQKVGKGPGGQPLTVAAFDTSAAAMRRMLGTKPTRLQAEEGTGEHDPVRQLDPPPRDIYTIKLTDDFGDVTYRLTGLHVMTKELRHWLWVTLWWSDTPDEDFGADRPSDVKGPWRNYKMCVVTHFDESDKDPGGHYRDGTTKSLGEALDVVHAASRPHTWCSNPFIETGFGNARTNCIGCHQHAGLGFESGDTFLDKCPDPRRPSEGVDACRARQLKKREKFPFHGRSMVRKNFPSDYLFSLDMPAPDLIGRIKSATEE